MRYARALNTKKKKKVVEFKFDLFITQIEKDVSAYPIKGLGARQQTRVNCRLEENREAVFNFSRVTFALLLLLLLGGQWN